MCPYGGMKSTHMDVGSEIFIQIGDIFSYNNFDVVYLNLFYVGPHWPTTISISIQ